MKKGLLVITALILLGGCALFFPPSAEEYFDQWEEMNTDPFGEIGQLILMSNNYNTNYAALHGALSYEMENSGIYSHSPTNSNSIVIAVDFSYSLFPPSKYPDHQPFLLSGFNDGVIAPDVSGQSLLYWESVSNDFSRNHLLKSPLSENLHVIELRFTNGAILTNGNSYLAEKFKIGNYLNTTEGLAAYDGLSDNEFWSIIGYQDIGYADYRLELTNIDGIIKINEIVIDEYGIMGSVDSGAYITPNGRGVGIMVNDAIVDWSMQTDGLAPTQKDIQARFLFNIQSETNQIDWDDWESGGKITGTAGFLHTNENAEIYEIIYGRPLSIDRDRHLAVVDLTIPKGSNPGFAFKIGVNDDTSWMQSEKDHHFLILPQDVSNVITIRVDSEILIP